MNGLIDKLYEIIKCYRQEEGDYMSKEIITKWITQFDEADRSFVLRELCHIMKDRYITKVQFKDYLRTTFFNDIKGVMKEKFNQEDIKEIFKRSHFINHQPEGKSQKIIINLFEEVITEELALTLDDCGGENPLCYIYLDDVLCTGDTIFKGIAGNDGWFNKKTIDSKKTNREILEEKKIPVFIVFYSIHLMNMHKLFKRISYAQKDYKVLIWYFWQDNHEIDNNYNKSDSKLQYIFPIEDKSNETVIACQKQIEEKIDKHCKKNKYAIPEGHFYRRPESPDQETLFSSPDSRNRFETIILNKSIEVYNKANSSELRMRPLGYGLYTDKSFGYGTLLFSWRNVPFNTPLVFWYEHNGWNPLFKRKFTTYQKSWKEIMKSVLSRSKR